MAYTGPGVLDPMVEESANKTLLSTPTSQYVYSAAALKQEHGTRAGGSIIYRRANPLNSFPVALPTDGSSRPPASITATDISANVVRYGEWTQLDEQTVMFNESAAIEMAADRLGDAMRKTEDQLLSALLSASATHVDAKKGGNGDIPTEFNADDNDIMTTMLLNANGNMFTAQIDATENFSTTAIRPAYLVMASTELVPDIQAADDFVSVSNYGSYGSVFNGEWGNVNNARLLLSTQAPSNPNSSANANTTYEMAYVAKEAYGMIDQVAGEKRFIYHPAYLSDALEMSVTAGVKFYQGQALFNDAWAGVLNVTLNV